VLSAQLRHSPHGPLMTALDPKAEILGSPTSQTASKMRKRGPASCPQVDIEGEAGAGSQRHGLFLRNPAPFSFGAEADIGAGVGEVACLGSASTLTILDVYLLSSCRVVLVRPA
jgi:hypothetical protein